MSKKILIVDDSLAVRVQVTRLLTAAGFTVVDACDGQDGLEKLVVHPDVSLVVCDVNMPRMSGIEFLERVRPGTKVVMLTTEGQVELRQRAKTLGSQGWIKKPFKPELLVETARKLTS
jgi:two-component system chemotaxis response regulator CheY